VKAGFSPETTALYKERPIRGIKTR